MKRSFSVQLKRYEVILGLIWLCLYLTVFGTFLQVGMSLLGMPEDDVGLLNGVYFFSCFIVTAAVFHRFLADSLPGVWQQPGRFIKAVIFGFCVYECFEILMSFGLQLGYPNFATPNDDTVAAIADANYAVMWVGAVLLAPMTEEMLLRGLVFGTLRRKNRVVAYVVTALLFAAMHVLVYIPEMSLADIFVNLLLYGLPAVAISACYEKADTIWAPITLHMVINLLGMSAMAAGA